MGHHDDNLLPEISKLTRSLTAYLDQRRIELDWHGSLEKLATKHDLKETETKIMSAISDFSVKQNAFNDRMDTAIEGIKGDVKTLNDKIEALQNSAGQITPEDQALLDAIEARGDAITSKLEALDALTPPTPPPA
jgi:hypothetical protein